MFYVSFYFLDPFISFIMLSMVVFFSLKQRMPSKSEYKNDKMRIIIYRAFHTAAGRSVLLKSDAKHIGITDIRIESGVIHLFLSESASLFFSRIFSTRKTGT